jgi:metal-sulfur cluster biosynthetic enzyme
LIIEGNFSEEEKEKMETIKKEITDVLSHVRDAKIDINITRGVGSQMGELHNVG